MTMYGEACCALYRGTKPREVRETELNSNVSPVQAKDVLLGWSCLWTVHQRKLIGKTGGHGQPCIEVHVVLRAYYLTFAQNTSTVPFTSNQSLRYPNTTNPIL